MTFNILKRYGMLALVAAAACGSSLHAQSVAELAGQARSALLDYNFSEAERLYNAASKKMKKGDPQLAEEIAKGKKSAALAESFLERVARIEVIDSITARKSDFFKLYHLPQASGHLTDAENFPFHQTGEIDYIFSSESGDYMIWAEPDSTGYFRLREATRFTDGKWSEPSAVDDELSPDADALFPFMCDDGVTLYFASDGEESMGGFDIMVATRDEPGSFLQPTNIGMPFNSPYDDYLLAYDEVNEVGWWATDRNSLGDDLTIYIFRNPETRVNYPEDEENLISFARLDNIKATLDPDTDYSALLKEIRSIVPGGKEQKNDFTLPMPGGKKYTLFSDFRSSSARNMMRQYLESKKMLDASEEKLSSLRKKYHSSPSTSVAKEISRLEEQVEADRSRVATLLSEVYRAEKD